MGPAASAFPILVAPERHTMDTGGRAGRVSPSTATVMVMTEATDAVRSERKLAVWGREIPIRNRYFTGRERELAELHDRLTKESAAVIGQPAQPIYGMGGVGKTEIAAEYAHKHRDEYDLVWWVRAEQEQTIIASLIALGRRMNIPDFRPDERDYSLDLVLTCLTNQNPYHRWLLIYDNAQSASTLSRYVPSGGGHVLITSRDRAWRRVMRLEGIEVGEFTPEETVEFLQRRVPALRPDDEGRTPKAAAVLAEELGHLPLAAEHAAAYLNETGAPVQEYIERFRESAHGLMADAVDIAYPETVATTWSLSQARISREADALFKLLASLSSEPISEELLVQPGTAPSMPAPLDRVLSGVTGFRRAARELGRYSLVKLDSVRNVVQLHRVVQKVTRDRMLRDDPEEAARYREAAHLLLGASDPGSPEREEHDRLYQRSFQHLVPSQATESANPVVRRLIINQIERLYQHGGVNEALDLGVGTLEGWRELFGPDDRQTLALAVQVANVLRLVGSWEESLRLLSDTRQRLLDVFGERDPVFLICSRAHGVGLRLLGHYADALENDLELLPLFERELRPDHPHTLGIRNNLAISLRCMGRFREALAYDEETLAERMRVFGPAEPETLNSQFAVARDLRGLGRYEESLDLIRLVSETLGHKGTMWNPFRLLVAVDFTVALRRTGYYAEAFSLGRETLVRHYQTLGREHRRTLQCATNVINDYRLHEDLAGAQRLGEDTLETLEHVVGPDHPNTLAACANLAIVLRMRSYPDEARRLSERAVTGLASALGEKHPNTLIAMHNLASDLMMMGETNAARQLSEQVAERCLSVHGDLHPNTLAALTNLSLDRRAAGDREGYREMRERALAGYRDSALPDHPDAGLAAKHGRVNLGIEPMTD
jgi:tetratricopeptide (TPR) repeat protein